MRVALAHPGIYDDADPLSFPPWGVLSVGTQALRAGHDVSVHDFNGVDPLSASRLLLQHDPHIVGLTGKTGNSARRLCAIVGALRQQGFAGRIAVGGPLVSSFPNPNDELWSGVDARFTGEGELPFQRWLANGAQPSTESQPGIAGPLSELSAAQWWQPLARYVHSASNWPGLERAGLHVSSARGCTQRCTFCYLNTAYPNGRFRYLAAPELLNQLNHVSRILGVSGFYFVDDCFIATDSRRAEEFANLNIAQGSPFRFGLDAGIRDLARPELLALMYEAGLRSLYVGVESGSSRIRRMLGKSSASADVADLLNRTIENGVLVRASIGVGWPTETLDEAKSTLSLIDACPRLAFDAFRYQALPGVPLTIRQGPPLRTSLGHPAFDDFSLSNQSNHSAMSDSDFATMWAELSAREADRLSAYHAGRL